MHFNFKLMDENHAKTIAGWHYDGVYRFYDLDQDLEDLEEMLNPESWPDRYFAVVDEYNKLIGYFYLENDETGSVTFGVGLRPDLTGQGLGQEFSEAGLEFAKEKFNPTMFRLEVATFNQRAIRVYEKLGFKPDGVYMNETNGGQYEFLRMMRKA